MSIIGSLGEDGPEFIIRALATHLRPMLLASWKERRNALFMENADKMKRLLDSSQKKLDEVTSCCFLEANSNFVKYIQYAIFMWRLHLF